jgi:predicted TIM-barrel fold metal-dependent hydrolase
MENSDFTLKLNEIPVIDNHCHPPLKSSIETESEFKRFFTESFDPRIVSSHVQNTLFYPQSLRDINAMLGRSGEPNIEAILTERNLLGTAGLVRRIVQRANIGGMIVDFGYQADDSHSVDDMRGMLRGLDCPCFYVLRLETRAEQLMIANPDFDRFMTAFVLEFTNLRVKGVAALKSIIAYRSGLDIQPTTESQAAEAFNEVMARQKPSEIPLRLTSKTLLDYLIVEALNIVSTQNIPVQFHTALGDTDVDLLKANPLLLKPIFDDQRFRDVPIVLLHCYPYLKEAAYLTNMYGNAYLDLSMTVPLLNFSAPRALEDVLGMAPTSKVLYGSDAPSLVEFLWLGAVSIRRALGQVLSCWIQQGLPETEAERIAYQILHQNAERLYNES